MEFWLQKEGGSKFQLPVKPADFTVSVTHGNTVVNVIQLGDINLIGKTGLREISLSSFFPAKNYNFSNNSNRKAPLTYVKRIETWRKSGEPIRVIITGVLNMECTIESFTYGEKDATGDIYYTIYLKEYKKISTKKATVKLTKATVKKTDTKKTSTAKTSTRSLKEVTTVSKTYKVKSGDSLWSISKKTYGTATSYPKIVSANKDAKLTPSRLAVGQSIRLP
jgi:nucleoid-associated protein YgaU